MSNIHFTRYCERETKEKTKNVRLKNDEGLQSRSPPRESIIPREHRVELTLVFNGTRATIQPYELCELLERR